MAPNIDSRAFVYLPRWTRIAAIGLLLAALAFGVGIALYLAFFDASGIESKSDVIVVSISLAQTALSALAVAWVLLYSERDVNTKSLQQRQDEFLEHHLPSILSRVTPSYEARASVSAVSVTGKSDIFGASYKIESNDQALRMWVGVNVSRLIIIYWLCKPKSEETGSVDNMKDVFRYTFGNADRRGFDVFFEPAVSPRDEEIFSIWATVSASENLLTSPSERLFWMQDIAMMTESFWRTAIRNELKFSAADPSPL